jgi:hypothetical protein
VGQALIEAPRLLAIVDRAVCGSDASFLRRSAAMAALLRGEPRLAVRLRGPLGLVAAVVGELGPHPRIVVPAGAAVAGCAVSWTAADLAGAPGSGGGVTMGASPRGALLGGAPTWPGAAVGAGSLRGAREPSGGQAPRAIFASVHSLAEAAAAAALGAHVLVFAPVFAPRCKPRQGRGVAALAELAASTPLPVLALGGVIPERAAACLGAGARGVAALSPFSAPDQDALAAARDFLAALSR